MKRILIISSMISFLLAAIQSKAAVTIEPPYRSWGGPVIEIQNKKERLGTPIYELKSIANTKWQFKEIVTYQKDPNFYSPVEICETAPHIEGLTFGSFGENAFTFNYHYSGFIPFAAKGDSHFKTSGNLLFFNGDIAKNTSLVAADNFRDNYGAGFATLSESGWLIMQFALKADCSPFRFDAYYVFEKLPLSP